MLHNYYITFWNKSCSAAYFSKATPSYAIYVADIELALQLAADIELEISNLRCNLSRSGSSSTKSERAIGA